MKTVVDDNNNNKADIPVGEFFCDINFEGTPRRIYFRKMTTKDLIQMERKNSNLGDAETTARMIERLSVNPGKITITEVEKLEIKDFRKLGDYVAEMNGMLDDEDDEGN